MDAQANVREVIICPYPTETPRDGVMVQRPEEWVKALKKGLRELFLEVNPGEIGAVSFSGHMSGVVLLGKEGNVLYPCIMLADARSDKECEEIDKAAGAVIREVTGNPVINAFSLPKLLWMKKWEPEIYKRTCAYLSPKDYLRFLLTGQVATEYTDAYNSLCVDRETGQWRGDIIAAAGLDLEKFPDLYAPSDLAGEVSKAAEEQFGLRAGTPVAFGAADMACGAIGNGLFHEGDSTLTLGTCATFLTMVPGVEDRAFGKITYHMHVLPDRVYGLGSHFNGGLAVNWMSRILSPAGEIDYELIRLLSKQAEKVPAGSSGVMTLPFLAGSGSPYFNSKDRQTVMGINTSSTRAELFKSGLEGITYNLKQSLDIFGDLLGAPLKRIVLGGGGTKVEIWPQIIADVFDTALSLAENADASAVGAALIGGRAVGLYPDLESAAVGSLDIKYELKPDVQRVQQYGDYYKQYEKAYEILKLFQ